MRSTIFASLLLASTITTLGPAHAQQCQAARVLIVLDRSSSMVTGTVGSQTKWEVATNALSTVLSTYESNIEFGLMVFPNPNECGPGAVKVNPGLNKAGSIMNQLATPPPESGNWTPMAQSLDVAAKLNALADSTRSNHVLLITDGWQWCDPYEASTRFSPVVSVQNLTSLNVTTHVVGFGGSVDALTLNKMAEAAGTKVASNCDIHGDDPAATNNCYFQANDPGQLLAALQKIAHDISTEVCDGLDNDCNGAIDDGLTGPKCATQHGVCSGATKPCGGTAGWTACSAIEYQKHAESQGKVYQPEETLCDGQDNDCDGTVDESGCECTEGETRPCGFDRGECKAGTQSCTNGKWGGCAGEVTASTEICDGLDNDCDGTVDGVNALCANGAPCIDGKCEEAITTGGGCDCKIHYGGAGAAGPAALLLLVGCLLLVRRRRR